MAHGKVSWLDDVADDDVDHDDDDEDITVNSLELGSPRFISMSLQRTDGRHIIDGVLRGQIGR